MDNVASVAVFDGLQELINILSDKLWLESIAALFENFEQIFLQVFKHKVEAVRPIDEF